MNFNPRSREGSDSINFANCFCDTISIRAPARGATFNSPVNDPVLQFQSALPRGERHLQRNIIIPTKNFNPRSREGSDPGSCWTDAALSNFNPRSREGSDISGGKFRDMLLISIRAPARGATGSTLQCFRFVIQFQSALPRGERRSGAIRLNNFFIISIRAPARGATQYQGGANAWIEFQSALPRGERPDISSEIHKAFLISIRAPARGATESANTIAAYNYISIRAPARGATCTFTHILSIRQFQSALPRGERRGLLLINGVYHVFQSALPRGERLATGRSAVCRTDFNPRSREGSDDSFKKVVVGFDISIRAPARGATLRTG